MARAPASTGGSWLIEKDWGEQEYGSIHAFEHVSSRSAPEQAAVRLRIVRSTVAICIEQFRHEVTEARRRTPEQIEIDTLRTKLAALEAVVAGLQRRAEGQLHYDPVHEWVREHPDAASQYRGQHVAIHPVKGVVAHGAELSDVMTAVRKLGMLDSVEFDYFPEP